MPKETGNGVEDLCLWNEFHVYLAEKGKEIVQIPGDGLCFFRGLQNCLGVQYNENFSMEEIKQRIIGEITRRPKFYLRFHPCAQTAEGLKDDIIKFFHSRVFACDTVDLLIGVSCNAFDITLWVYQEDEHHIMNSIQYSTGKDSQKRRHCHMILYRNRNNIKGLGSHYNSIVSIKKNNGRRYEDYGSHQPPAGNEVELESQPLANENEEDETLGPPSQGSLETPVPSPHSELELDDFNPTVNHSTAPPYNFDDEPDASMYNVRSKDEKIVFPYDIVNTIPTEHVAKVPYNINGMHNYEIPVEQNDWHKLQEDGRWFLMRSSTMRKSNKVRKIGKCLGSFVCQNDACPKFTSGKGRNTYAFSRIGLNLNECKTCGAVAERIFCGAVKLTLFNPDTNKLDVSYAGTHNCTLKRKASYTIIASPVKRSILKPILQKNPKATAKQISEEAAEKFLRLGRPDMAKESVKLSQDRRLVAEMKGEVLKMVSKEDANSFTAVANLRKDMKLVDPYYIYKLNDGNHNDEISFVFKSSTCSAQLALEMDCEDPENKSCLREEPVYVDAMHSRVENYKNITAWVKNPIIRSVMHIATMEAQHEDTQTMVLFYRLLNEMLQKVSGKKNYKFNPSRFYVDEAGANKNAIKKVFGRRALDKTVTCQWHFLHNARLKKRFVKSKWKKGFYTLCKRLIKAPTRSEYESISALLKKICAESEILDWFLWWDERKFHIVPAFRGFNLSGLNLAESGQSGMKPKTRKKLKLVDAAYKDIAQILRQDEAYRAYIGNVSKEIGKGLNIRQMQERDRKSQIERAKHYSRALFHGDVNEDTDDEEGNRPCLPLDKAKHKAPRTYSRKNPTQKKKENAAAVQEDEDANLFDSDLSSIHDDEIEDVPGFIDEDYIRSVQATKIIFLNATIKKCYGCDLYFEHKKMMPPLDLVFSKKTKRKRPDGEGGYIRGKEPTNAFFCIRDMACLQFEFPNIEKNQVYMSNEAFLKLTPVHKKFLKLKGYWEPILHNRRLKGAFQ